ncbi:hypothetical protein FK529_14325 [Tsukamurella asaccharolytica]|uniref:Uncharacterized protein n=1 Tax=Tsukamurella asaccharolytica TaxID=2592067 RepID=A0A5C5R6B1_9ACTN|nr:hypothetical protein [Tsukamurella asaccharolytica]TWS18747.1 hypothetical protein FK529_14325 [Tsukamurella asaccharolytica]
MTTKASYASRCRAAERIGVTAATWVIARTRIRGTTSNVVGTDQNSAAEIRVEIEWAASDRWSVRRSVERVWASDSAAAPARIAHCTPSGPATTRGRTAATIRATSAVSVITM